MEKMKQAEVESIQLDIKQTSIQGKRPKLSGKQESVIKQLNGKVIDDRVRVDANEYPYCTIGLIKTFTNKMEPQKYYKGTGCLIGDNIVLTCAHNCFRADQEITKILFVLGPKDKRMIYTVKKFHYLEQFSQLSKTERMPYDFALMQLDEDISEIYGSMGTNFLANKQQTVGNLTICGFPGTIFNEEGNQIQVNQQMYANGIPSKQFDIGQRFIRHKIATTPGQSGSPIFYEQNGDYFTVGVHFYGAIKDQKLNDIINMGILLNKDNLSHINQWVKPSLIFEETDSSLSKQQLDQILGGNEDKNICKIILNNKQFSDLPESLWHYKLLETLSLQNIKLKVLSPSISNINKLRILDLKDNLLSELPQEFTKLVELRKLSLTRNNLSFLPPNFTHLKNLVFLYLNENKQLKSLPETLGELSQLIILKAKSCGLTSLPASISNLSELEQLDVSYNKLERLPKQANKFKNLRKLICNNNELVQFIAVSELKSIQQIDLGFNQIKKLNNLFGKSLSGDIKKLNLENNLLEKVDSGFKTRLSNTEINLKGNKLDAESRSYFQGRVNVTIDSQI